MHDQPTNYPLLQFISRLTFLFCYHDLPWCFLSKEASSGLLCISSRPVCHEFSCQWAQPYTHVLYDIHLIHPKALTFSWPQASLLLHINIRFLNQFSSTIPLPKTGCSFIQTFLSTVNLCYVWPRLLKYQHYSFWLKPVGLKQNQTFFCLDYIKMFSTSGPPLSVGSVLLLSIN